MSFDVKKLILRAGGGLLILLSLFLSTCTEPIENNSKPFYTNVEYSEDGKSLTLYLDGSAPVRTDRALSHRLALLGYDYFEVVFLYNTDNTPANYIIAQAAWELGEPAGISGIYRTDTGGGIIYYGTTPVGIPAVGQGSAILFVGNKADKALLGIGVLSSIDGVDISTANRISTTTTKVRFQVNALKAGVHQDSNISSFQVTTPSVPAQANPLLTISIGGEPYPYFYMRTSTAETATYKFDVNLATGNPLAHPYTFYQPAIIYAGGADCWNIRPQYTFPPNIPKYETPSYVEGHSASIPSITYPATANTTFNGTVNFNIATGILASTIFALTFEIPVYALYSTPESVIWYMKPGHNSYSHELDNGLYKNGGAILIGVEITGVASERRLEIEGPIKKYYGADGSATMKFSLVGNTFMYIDGSDKTNVTNSGHLTFYYDQWPLDGIANVAFDPTNFSFTSQYYGKKVAIRVVWDNGTDPPLTLQFDVEVNQVADIVIPYENRVFIAKPNDFTQLSNRIQNVNNTDPFLFIFTENLNIPNTTINLPSAKTIFMVSTKSTEPPVIIGRTAGASLDFTGAQATVYIGTWPFNEPVFAGGDVITNEEFSINAGGTWQSAGVISNPGSRMFTGLVSVTVFSDMVIHNSGSL
jgi:hypothetical protein